MNIGRHGEPFGEDGEPLTVARAKNEARKLAGRIANGVDPAADRRAFRVEPTLAELATWYLDEHLPSKPRGIKPSTLAGYRTQLRRILPVLGTRKISTVTRDDVLRLHRSMHSTPYHANRIRALLRAMFRAAKNLGIVTENPAEGIDPFQERSRVETHEGLLTGEETARLIAALDAEELTNPSPSFAIRLGC